MKKQPGIRQAIHSHLLLLPALVFFFLVVFIGKGFAAIGQITMGDRGEGMPALSEKAPTPTPDFKPEQFEPVIEISPKNISNSISEPDLDFVSYQFHSWNIPEETSNDNDFWIEIDLTNQMLYAYRNNQIISGFKVSTGTKGNETVTGTYKIYAKYPAVSMAGPGYDLEDVPYTAFFYKGYAIHGTYWHHNFGTPMSHGCVNMDTEDAAWIYANADVGTYVMVHY